MSPDNIVVLIEHFAAAVDRSPSTVARWASGDGRTHRRLRDGCDITTRRATTIAHWLADHWPKGTAWPAGVRRPKRRRAA